MKNVFVDMLNAYLEHAYIKITKDIRLFCIGLQFVKVLVYNFKKATLIRRSMNNSNNQRARFRQKNFNKNIFDFLRKKVFLLVTDITSDTTSDTSTVFVTITSEQVIVRHLDFRLKNSFIKHRFRHSDNSGIRVYSQIPNFINFWKKAINIQMDQVGSFCFKDIPFN